MATSTPSRRSATFASLEDPTYRRLWLGGLVSFLAVQMEFIARGWLAYELTGTNSGLGAVFLGFGVPMLLLTPWGGVVADRLPKRKVLIACQLVLGASSALLALAVVTDVITYWMLIAAAVLQGIGFSFLGPARMAFTGELVGPDRLSNAIVLQQMSMNGTRVFGPSIAGALIGIAFVGVGGVYAVTRENDNVPGATARRACSCGRKPAQAELHSRSLYPQRSVQIQLRPSAGRRLRS